MCGVLDDAAGLSQAPFQVDVSDRWEHGPSDELGCIYYPLEGLVVVNGAILVPGRDVTGQDALDYAVEVFGEDPGWHADLF
jgi:hypothetical protein